MDAKTPRTRTPPARSWEGPPVGTPPATGGPPPGIRPSTGPRADPARQPAAVEARLAATHPGPAAPACEAAGRIAQSEETVEAEVIRCLPGALAVVRTPAGTEEVGVTLVDARPGDAVLVHAGLAIAVL